MEFRLQHLVESAWPGIWGASFSGFWHYPIRLLTLSTPSPRRTSQQLKETRLQNSIRRLARSIPTFSTQEAAGHGGPEASERLHSGSILELAGNIQKDVVVRLNSRHSNSNTKRRRYLVKQQSNTSGSFSSRT